MFNALPSELKSLIVGFVTSSEDLRALCLVSRDFHEIAIQFLYKDVILKLGGPLDSRLSGLINPFNKGIEYMRELNVGIAGDYCTIAELSAERDNNDPSQRLIEGSLQQAHIMLKLLFETFQRTSPPIQLRKFRWSSWYPFALENWVLLCQSQSQLRNLEVGPLNRPYTSILSQIPRLVGALPELSEVDLFANSLDVLKAFQEVLQAQPKIRSLGLVVSGEFDGAAAEDLNDTSTEPGLLFRTIFSHLRHLHETPLRELKSVTLENIYLRYADRTLMQAVPFKSLEYLCLGNCAAADGLFTQLCEAQHLSSRLTTLHWYHKDETETHILETFERLLEALPLIEDLHVELANTKKLPKATAISRCTKTLRSLVVQAHNTPSVLLRYQCAEIDNICTSCTRLRELSIASPIFDAAKHRSSCDWMNFLASVRKLPYLITLNVQTLPGTEVYRTFNSLDIEKLEIYEGQLQKVAQHMFILSDTEAKAQGWGFGDRSMLAVVAFGANGESLYWAHEHFMTMKQLVFTRGKTVDGLGRTKMTALKTLLHYAVLIEPESDILCRSLDAISGGFD